MKVWACCPNRASAMAIVLFLCFLLLDMLPSIDAFHALPYHHPMGHRAEMQTSHMKSHLIRRHVSGTNGRVDFTTPTTKIKPLIQPRNDLIGGIAKPVLVNDGLNMEQLALPSLVVVISLIAGAMSSMGYNVHDVVDGVQNFVHHPQTVMEDCIASIHDMGAVGVLYFGAIYVVAEVLAVPALPLTLSAGYLFGLPTGVAVVLGAATIAASIAFLIGKTVLRSWVETTIVEKNPKIAKIDRAIGERGFKLLVLLRLSPIFPFALSNYVYGASSIDFPSYFWSTLIGFAPGTIAYVYTGMVGKELMLSGGETSSSQPWYVYAIGLTVLSGLLKLASDVATGILESVEEDDSELGGDDSVIAP